MRNKFFKGRYLIYKTIQDYLMGLPLRFNLKKEGHSVESRPIFSLTLGYGPIKILIWSQMHGDESTSTKAILDVIENLKNDWSWEKILGNELQLKIIPVLNPDGAVAYTRVNANGMDLNRDAIVLSQPESRLLQDIGNSFQPDFAFNMHDQNSIYGVEATHLASGLSFLAPGIDMDGGIDSSRKRAMQVIASVYKSVQEEAKIHTGRYKDEFNPNCMGEYFQMQGASTILFESGHVGEDYTRENTREFVYQALLKALSSIKNQDYRDFLVEDYFEIPLNVECYYDLIVRDVWRAGKSVDIAFRYKEIKRGNTIYFEPKVEKIGRLDDAYGHKEIEGKGRKTTNIHKKEIKLNDIIKVICLNGDKITIDLTNN